MLRYAKSKRGSKSKRKGSKNTGNPVALWKPCNPVWVAKDKQRSGEFVTPVQARKYANGTEQHRGHVHLPQCGCQRALGPRPKSESEIIRALAVKQAAKAVERHNATGRVCGGCRELLPLSGDCGNCQ